MRRDYLTKWLCLILVLTAGPGLLRADPAPAKSEYLRTFTGGFEYDRRTKLWAMFIIVQPLKQGPGMGPLYFGSYLRESTAW